MGWRQNIKLGERRRIGVLLAKVILFEILGFR
jgi:hypothetical protein